MKIHWLALCRVLPLMVCLAAACGQKEGDGNQQGPSVKPPKPGGGASPEAIVQKPETSTVPVKLWKSSGVAELRSLGNVRQLALGILSYADLNKRELPTADNWCGAIWDAETGGGVFISPQSPDVAALQEAEGNHSHYALNAALAGKSLNGLPGQTVLLFEADLGWNGSGGLEEAKRFAADHGVTKMVVGFVDGSCRPLAPKELDGLKWAP
ncbi:MAG: hypothetical protein CMO66_04185 [Verrucomicrobiales bacterium]|nr:hypothetical protein [Verrucomicrobiales bacterium]